MLFEGGYEEDEGGRQEEEKVVDRQFGQNQFTTFGIIPFVLKYCEVTNETITNVMNESVNMVFYIVSYEILKAKEQERQLKEIRNKNKR